MIMAGGSGKRLWPLTQTGLPKQLLPLFAGNAEGDTLIEHAWKRLEGVIPLERRFLCAMEEHRIAMRERLPDLDDEHYLGEPCAQDTINAITLTCAILAPRDEDAVLVVLPSDHVIRPLDMLQSRIEEAFRVVEDKPDRIVTFSIPPTEPSTALGYVERTAPIDGFENTLAVSQFHEKPDEATARRYLAGGRCAWNSGMFVVHAHSFLEVIEEYCPDNYAGAMRIARAWNTDERENVLRDTYPSLPADSVDNLIMQPAARDPEIEMVTVMLPLDLWVDVGTWPTFGEPLKADARGNRATCATHHLDSRNIIAASDDPDHLIATIGCENLIIVKTGKATLVMPAPEADRLRALVDSINEFTPEGG